MGARRSAGRRSRSAVRQDRTPQTVHLADVTSRGSAFAAPEGVALAAAVVPEAVDAARSWLDELRHVTLEIDGDDVLAAGVPEGPDVGRALARALARKLDGEVAGRDAELGAALAAIGPE